MVASEVKGLAGQTASATQEIADQIAEIQRVTKSAVNAISGIGKVINEVADNSTEVASAVEEQRNDISEITTHAGEAANSAKGLGESVGVVTEQASIATDLSSRQDKSTADMQSRIEDMQTRLHIAIEATQDRQDTLNANLPFDLLATVDDEANRQVMVRNLSTETADLICGAGEFAYGDEVQLTISGIGQFSATVGDPNVEGHNLSVNMPGNTRKQFEKFDQNRVAPDQPVIAIGAEIADRISELFENAVDGGDLTMEDLFDEDYQLVAGSDPVQHLTRFTAFTDKNLPDIQEPVPDRHDSIVFGAAVDRNGYLPTHNLKYCAPQRPDDPVWNAANCRNHRIFDDKTGLAAGQNTAPFLVQSYLRDMGGGNFIVMKDLSVPIYVKGRHWGGFRIGYSL